MSIKGNELMKNKLRKSCEQRLNDRDIEGNLSNKKVEMSNEGKTTKVHVWL